QAVQNPFRVAEPGAVQVTINEDRQRKGIEYRQPIAANMLDDFHEQDAAILHKLTAEFTLQNEICRQYAGSCRGMDAEIPQMLEIVLHRKEVEEQRDQQQRHTREAANSGSTVEKCRLERRFEDDVAEED